MPLTITGLGKIQTLHVLAYGALTNFLTSFKLLRNQRTVIIMITQLKNIQLCFAQICGIPRPLGNKFKPSI